MGLATAPNADRASPPAMNAPPSPAAAPAPTPPRVAMAGASASRGPTSPGFSFRPLRVLDSSPECLDESCIASSRRRIAASATTALAATRSSASPVCRRALARIFDSAAVRFSLVPSSPMTVCRTFAPRAAAAALSPTDLNWPARAGPPLLKKSNVMLAATALLEECYVLRHHRLTCCDVSVGPLEVVSDDPGKGGFVAGAADNQVARLTG